MWHPQFGPNKSSCGLPAEVLNEVFNQNTAMPPANVPHLYFFMFLNWALVFVPDNCWSRVAMGSTAESQRVSEQNLHKSWWCLYKHRWSWNKDRKITQ